MITETALRGLRQMAIDAHQGWKSQILMGDAIVRGDWNIMWPNGEVESSDPLVENIYKQALEDKMITAGAIPMSLFTQPTRGTRQDRGERDAQKRKRVMLSYWERSNLRKMRQRFFRDWYHTGVMAGNPWATGLNALASDFRVDPAERFAYFQTVNPRHLYPLGWDNRGRLVAGLIIRRKRVADLEADWGKGHHAITMAKIRHERANAYRQVVWLEEIWYFDQDEWAVAIGDSSVEAMVRGEPFGPADAHGNMIIEWLVAPHKHYLGSCPLKAVARTTYNDSPEGALMDVIPSLRTAQNFMARLLDDLNQSIYAPTLLDNVENPEEYGLGAVLIGTGVGKANIIRDRPPVNFEAQQTVNSIMDQARREAFEPAQRSGEAGASIISGKGTMSLMGTFNAELAAAQGDAEVITQELTSATACLDAYWCGGVKQIHVSDMATGEMTDETYDPAALFKEDYRCVVSYGDRTGVDDANHLVRLSTMRSLEGMALRTFMAKSGMIEDPLAEETEIVIEKLVKLFTDVLLPQQIQAGDREVMLKFVDLIDTDQKTARQAMFEVIRGANLAPAQGPGGPTSPGGRADIIRMMRSLQAGGQPGSAEGLPASQLPGATQRQLANVAPGGGNAI